MKKKEINKNKEENIFNDSTLNDLNEFYSKYVIDDIDFLSQSSDNDINAKMNNMISKRKNLNNTNSTKKNLEKKEDEKKEREFKEEINNISAIKHTSFTQKNNAIEDEKTMKISSKIKRLELLKKKEEKYMDIINFETDIRKKEIEKIQNQINKQNDKNEKIKKGITVSHTDSKIEYGLEPSMKVENGLAYISHFFENHIAYLKLDFLQSFKNKSLIKSKTRNNSKKNRIQKKKTFVRGKPKDIIRSDKRKTSYLIKSNDMLKFKIDLEIKQNIYNNNIIKEKNVEENIIGNNKLKRTKQINKNDNKMRLFQHDDTFIKMNNNHYYDINKPVDKSQLIEYDLFYKEQFFKNDVFKYDVNNIEDKEEKEINREMNKLDVKRRLIAKKKEKEVNILKGLDTEDLDIEINDLEKEYKKAKTIEKPKLNLIMNNTIGLLHKGRMLECYFIGKKEEDFPRFAMESEKEIGAREVIDFKPLRKEEQARRYFDYCICLKQRKEFNKCLIYTRFWSRFFLDNWIFDNLSFLVVTANTIIILISDPTDPKNLGNVTDRYFLFFYTLEVILKIISFTFISAEDAYLKDYWNILDFIVVIVGWASFILELLFENVDLTAFNGLRAVRILRPLRLLKKIKGLRKLATALIASIGHLTEITFILFYIFFLFAIAGSQMWQGNFFKRCMNVNYGYIYSTKSSEYMCSFDSDCEELNTYGMNYICAKGYINPDSGAINFDNILTGFVTIFAMASLEGWTNVFTYASKTFKDKVYINVIIIFLYFHIFIFFCAFYLINLFLAVTNSEFEHIESERKSLIEKKSFFQLIKAKYDLREKEKINKKEKEKKLKEINSKKSNQSLADLYYKVKEEAFHIHKKKRNIPILYSTVKDMYIMSNDNPEELYLQKLRIEKEEEFLTKDISRQQKEINDLIKAKKEEMKNISEELFLKTSTQQSRNNISNNNLHKITSLQQNITNNNKNTIYNNVFTLKKTFSNNLNIYSYESLAREVKKYIFKINKEIIKDSIDRTQKFIKEKTNNITKRIHKVGQEDKEKNELRKKMEKKGKKKAEFYQIIMEEDLPYEQEIKKLDEEKKLEEIKLKNQNNLDKSMREKKKKKSRNNNNMITEHLSFMSDLSLSNLDDSFTQKKTIINNEYLDFEDNSIESQKDILLCDKKEIGDDAEKLEQKINFYRPSSILAPIIKFKYDKDIQKKLLKMQDKFNLKSFLKKELNKGTNMNHIGKRRSFLKFLKYTQEMKDFDNYVLNKQKSGSLYNSENKNICDSINNDDMKNLDNYDSITINKDNNEKSILSTDSYLSDNENISFNDIDISPQEIKENNIMLLNPNESENKLKIMNSNKITQIIRDSVFDRTSINTNIELTTVEQSNYLKKMNENLNNNLYIDSKEPRGRKIDELDKSYRPSERNYEPFLQSIFEINENISKDIEKEKGIESKNSSIKHIFNLNENIRSVTKKLSQKQKRDKNNESLIESDNSNVSFGIKTIRTKAFDKSSMIKNSLSFHSSKSNILENALSSKDNGFYIFKAKSIEKNKDKYPKENTNDFLVREENRPNKEPLTVKQEGIPDNLRGKKYYLNYLFNISDKDLKVKDNFRVDHWKNEILGKKTNYIKKKRLPESIKAFFVFNDKKLNLKRYKYFYHKDIEYKDEECSYLTHHLKYLPRCILETMPSRIRNFGKYAVGKEVKIGSSGNKSTLLTSNSNLNADKSQIKSFDSRSGKTFEISLRNKSSIMLTSSFSNHYKTQEEIKYKRNLFERAYKKIDELNYRTLSNFFIDEEKFFSKLIDEKRRIAKIREIEIKNNEKQNKIIVKNEITNIKIYDLKTNSSRYVQWSGPDVLKNKNEDDYRKKWNKMIDALEDFNIIIWSNYETIKRGQKIRYAFYVLSTNDYFEYTILSIVIIYSFFMALDGNLLKPETLERMNNSYYAFNSIFILEYLLKFIGLGPIVYYSDPFTYLDTIIIAFAIFEYVIPNEVEGKEQSGDQQYVASNLSMFRFFRIFRILRLAKVLRKLKSLRLIIMSMSKAIANVSYIVIILIMFILIFELLGMSLLSESYHYKSFSEGFYITYQVLTMENWDGLLYELWNINEFSFLYYAIWIFLGNFIIFNLFTSVLLQAFGEDEKDFDLDEDEVIENMYSLPDYLFNLKKAEQEHTKTISNQKRKSTVVKQLFRTEEDIANIVIDSSSSIGTHSNFNKSNIENSGKISTHNTINTIANDESEEKNDNENNEESSDEDPSKYYSEVQRYMLKWKKINKLFQKNDCENSIYFLSQTNRFRIFCMKLINNRWFDRFILLMIIFSATRLIIDTFISGYSFVLIFDFFDTFLNTVFLLEAITKICALGFALDEGSYLSDNWNKIDIIIVLCSLADYEFIFEKYVAGNINSSSSQFLKVLRLLRTIRPLRFISHNAKLKIIIMSLVDSALPITNALFIVIVVYYIFSIIGITLFYENFHKCYILRDGNFDLAIDSFEDNLIKFHIANDMPSIQKFCAINFNGIMDTGPSFKFSNIATSLVTSYVLSTQEGWPDIMNSYRIYGESYGIFFIAYNLIVAYFFLNLFTGIMFRYFNEGFSKETKLAEDDKKAPKYYDFLTQITKANSHYAIWLRPTKGSFQY